MAHPDYPTGLWAFTMPTDGASILPCQHVGGRREQYLNARYVAAARLSRRLGCRVLESELRGVWVMPGTEVAHEPAIDCAYCGLPAMPRHKDHVVPLSRGGRDHPYNTVIACSRCNLAKGSRLPSEWLVDVPPLVLQIESRESDRLTNKDRRVRRPRLTALDLRLKCDVCEKLMLQPDHHCGDRRPTLLDCLETIVITWSREVERGKVVDIAIAASWCDQSLDHRSEHGDFSCGVESLDRLRGALNSLKWEWAARQKAETVVELLYPFESLVNPVKVGAA
jgi:5-methylcytosine-specific restriction endonuclease McrA